MHCKDMVGIIKQHQLLKSKQKCNMDGLLLSIPLVITQTPAKGEALFEFA